MIFSNNLSFYEILLYRIKLIRLDMNGEIVHNVTPLVVMVVDQTKIDVIVSSIKM